MTLTCPALLIAAPASGHGKTTFTAALARHHAAQGRRVRVFKTGPDFLDPMVLERASGHPVYQLDLWMGGEAHCRQLLGEAAASADLILVEGVMGLFDGTPSSADLAERFGLPVLAVIDASAMAQTFGAIAGGLAHHRPGLPFAGVVANRVGSAHHATLVREGMPADVTCLAVLPRNADAVLPSRHLGLVQADELPDIDARLDAAAAALADTALAPLPTPVAFARPGSLRSESDYYSSNSTLTPMATTPMTPLRGRRIAIARDAAFSFIYPANLDTLRALGAELCFFSPLRDAALPAADAVWLPGGYPELHLDTLSTNRPLQAALQRHVEAGKPLLAECGGMLFLTESLTDAAGNRAPMCGLLPGHAIMQKRLAALGLQSAALEDGELRGHTFHHSRLEGTGEPWGHGRTQQGGVGEAIFRRNGLTASYLHFYFPSNPTAAAALFLAEAAQ